MTACRIQNGAFPPLYLFVLAVASGLIFQPIVNAQPESKSVKRSWRVGAKVQTTSGAVTNLLITFPVPTDWPEQHVNVYDETIPREVRRAEYRDSDGVRQMVATIPRLNPRTEMEIHVILDITVDPVPYPERTDHLTIPERPSKEFRVHLSPSPLIESRRRNLRKKAQSLTEGIESPWQQVKALYTFVTTQIEAEGKEVIGADKTLKHGKGAPEDRCNLFIALCRAHQVPARTVWADDGEYAEFYLENDQGEGQWYPAVLFGKPEFGQMTDPRVIIQKGDNVKVPEHRQRQRLVVEHIRGSSVGGARPRVQFLRDLLPERERD